MYEALKVEYDDKVNSNGNIKNADKTESQILKEKLDTITKEFNTYKQK